MAERKLWREAAKAILALDCIHPRAQRRFVEAWSMVSFSRYVTDGDLFFALLRKVMPPYVGEAVELFRGQRRGDRTGLSWTLSPHIALKFAMLGEENIDPIDLTLDGPGERQPRADGVILQACVPALNIICAPCLLTGLEGEYIIDPRGVEFAAAPAKEAAGWIRDELAGALEDLGSIANCVYAIGNRHGRRPDEQIDGLLKRAADVGDADAEALIGGGLLHPFLIQIVSALNAASDFSRRLDYGRSESCNAPFRTVKTSVV
ncbi:hypothetical protein IVA80_15475 [Bradyrhizobium sp. 139]|uniref:hypothetical protein n=1 Tax=Bradyrhizobium sp. 139 TaxID=2782616 RepID=UPI001FFBAB5B|nr:hypothetical protein [Bradyrhizobium sp. 139]MCK1742225.1 hypothetical protein [Bradyrhizobium sp. 139]